MAIMWRIELFQIISKMLCFELNYIFCSILIHTFLIKTEVKLRRVGQVLYFINSKFCFQLFVFKMWRTKKILLDIVELYAMHEWYHKKIVIERFFNDSKILSVLNKKNEGWKNISKLLKEPMTYHFAIWFFAKER